MVPLYCFKCDLLTTTKQNHVSLITTYTFFGENGMEKQNKNLTTYKESLVII